MRLYFFVIGASFASYTNITVYEDEVTYPDNVIAELGEMSYKQFRKFYWENPELREQMEEKYREMQRECFLRGKCKKRKNKNKARAAWTYPKNRIDNAEICPDKIDDIVNGDEDDYDFHANYPDFICDEDQAFDSACSKKELVIKKTILLQRSATVGRIIIRGGKLIFKDWKEDPNKLIKLRATDIRVANDGELWIGSRKDSCRYESKADISLYGLENGYIPKDENNSKMKFSGFGWRFLYASSGSVIEIHGKKKLPWTWLNGNHIYRDNTPTDKLQFKQSAFTFPFVGHRLVFHILSAEGDLKDIYAVRSRYTPSFSNASNNFTADGDEIYKTMDEMKDILQNLKKEAIHDSDGYRGNIVFFYTDFHFPLNDSDHPESNGIRDLLEEYGFENHAAKWTDIESSEDNKEFALITGLFNTLRPNETKFYYKLPYKTSTGTFVPRGFQYDDSFFVAGDLSQPTKMVAETNPNQKFIVGPVKLSGEKDGDEFQIDLESEWFWSSKDNQFNKGMSIKDFKETMEKEYCRFDNLNLDIYKTFVDANEMKLKDDGSNLLWSKPLPSNNGPKCKWLQSGKNVWQKMKQTITYNGPGLGKDEFGNELGPILTLEERDSDGTKGLGKISTWLPGDKIIVASTSWDARESEVFELVECKLANNEPCAPDQVRINRPPRFTHWGKKDSRTGIDQRAEVGLLSRNVRFYGEMDEVGTCDSTGEKCDENCPGKCVKCRYAFTREQLTKSAFKTDSTGNQVQIHPGSPNHIETGTYEDPDEPVNPYCKTNDQCNCAGEYDTEDCVQKKGAFEKKDSEDKGFQRGCAYYEYINGEDKDLHGAHMVFKEGFKNAHISHMEIFNAGQPRLARYPVHWHHAKYVGEAGGYEDPSSAVGLSIHDSFSRFVTVHGTHEAIIKDNVGYNCHGHGYFLEDGYETDNIFDGNLGILPKPGLILPSERHSSVCQATNDGWAGYVCNEEGRLDPEGTHECDPGVVGSNIDKSGTKKYWNKENCKGLTVFWISNIQNYFDNNAAVGGHVAIWSFNHNASKKYSYLAIPRHPVTLERRWSNNKASAAAFGFIQDNSIKDKDEMVRSDSTDPKFSIGSGWKNRFYPMNEPEDVLLCDKVRDKEWTDEKIAAEIPACIGNIIAEQDEVLDYMVNVTQVCQINNEVVNNCEVDGAVTDYWQLNMDKDPRPNLWTTKAHGRNNFAVLNFDNWKIHHTWNVNWIRNAISLSTGWEFSDNRRSQLLKGSNRIPGAYKRFNDAVFVGFTRNTGHRTCGWKYKSLTEMGDCEESGPEIDRFCPGWTRTLTDDDYENGVEKPCPIVQQTAEHEVETYWFKPEGDVYRQVMFPKDAPMTAVELYDTWIPIETFHNTFWDIPGKDALRNAFGPHWGNKFQMISKNLYLRNNTFHNVDRYLQFADCDNRFFCQDFISNLKNYTCTDTDSDGNIKKCGLKDSQISVGRDVGDGERNTAFIDFDGIFTKNGEPGVIMAPQQTTLMTGCYSQKDVPGIELIMKNGPYGRVCPINLDTGFLAVNSDASKWIKPLGLSWNQEDTKFENITYESGMSEKGFKIEIKSARVPEDDDFHAPYIGHSNAKANDMIGGTFHQHIEADHPYMIRFKGTPAVKLSFGIKDAEKNSAFRFSFCVGKGNRLLGDKVLYQRAVFDERIGTCTTGSLSTSCEREITDAVKNQFDGQNNKAYELETLGEMAKINDKHSYYHDEETGWLHMKLIELFDRQHKDEEDEEDDIETLDFFKKDTYKIKGFPHMVGTPSKDGLLDDNVNNSFGAIYRWNMGKGQNILTFELENVYKNKETGEVYTNADPSEFDPSELEQQCDDFGENIFFSCENGFKVDIEDPSSCIDVDECESDETNDCIDPAECVNIDASYQCSCPEGYTETGDDVTCRDIDECEEGFHQCEDPAECSNSIGSYECVCPMGWQLESDKLRCIDINECESDDLNDCVFPAVCQDNDGSYTCSCPDGYTLNDNDKITCDNINECITGNHDCVHNCTDTTGSYKCICPNTIGWTLNEDEINCDDVDECTTMERNFKVPACPDNSKCVNNIGSYDCDCNSGYVDKARMVDCQNIDECADETHECHKNAICEDIPGEYICNCKVGYWGDGKEKCKNIDECDLNNEHDLFHECDVNAECTDTWGSYKCACDVGYEGSGRVGKCTNIDECESETNDCDSNATCSDTDGSFDCSCYSGYQGTGKNGECINIDECTNGDHTCNENTSNCKDNSGSYTCQCKNGYEDNNNNNEVCTDINECTEENDNCDENASCINNTGSFACDCNAGYTGSGIDGECSDVDECGNGTHDCNEVRSTCENNIGSFSCVCNDGFKINGREECEDIDECVLNTHDCDIETSNCKNTDGSFECNCLDGYAEIAGINDKICVDINECASEFHNDCHVNATCDNFDGSYNCTCNHGFVGNGFDCENSEKDECNLGTHNCDLTSTLCEDTPSSYTCNCKGPRYVQQDDFSCAFNVTSCDSKQELGVVWQWGKRCKPEKDGWYFKGRDSISLRCQINNQHWRKAYTGFNIFAKIHCGTDFLKGLADGRIQYNIADKVDLYQPGSAYYRNDLETPSRSSATVQWISPENDLKHQGGRTKDVYWLNLKGLNNIDMGSKNLETCLNEILVGSIPDENKAQDETGCVGSQKNVKT